MYRHPVTWYNNNNNNNNNNKNVRNCRAKEVLYLSYYVELLVPDSGPHSGCSMRGIWCVNKDFLPLLMAIV
jgi:hypothetical protein